MNNIPWNNKMDGTICQQCPQGPYTWRWSDSKLEAPGRRMQRGGSRGLTLSPRNTETNTIAKTALRSATVFCHAVFCNLAAHVVKISDLGRSRSGHQVTSSDLTSEKVQRLAIATSTERSLWNFQRLIWVTVCIKCISRIFDICDLRSGQFCDLSIISQWEKIEMRLFWTNIVQNALKHRFIGKHDTLNRKNAPVTPLCAPEVISGHERSPAVFWL